MADWSCDQTLRFLEYYQAEPIIWDPHHTHHKDKKKINDAWGRLSTKLNVSIKDLKTKKEILMGTFRRHLKKKQETTRSGAGSDDIYEPIWFAYAAMESFLLPVYTTRNTINTETGPSTSQVSKETVSDETSRELDETFGDETIENTGMETSSPSPSPAIPIQQSRSTSAKKPRRCPAPDTAEQQMATAFGQLTNALGQRQSHPTPKEDDECDLYAKLLATKLRELSKDERKLFMYEIDGIFVNKIKRRLSRRETPSPLYSNPYSRPSTASTSYAQSEANIHIPNRPSSAVSIRDTPSPQYSSPYSRPPTASTSYAQSEANIHIPDRPSSALTSHSEPIKYVYASKQPVQFSIQPPSDESANTYSIQSPSVQSANTYSIQPPSAQSANTYFIQSSSVQTANTYSAQLPSEQSCNSPETETIRKSDIINISLLNSFETFESEASET